MKLFLPVQHRGDDTFPFPKAYRTAVEADAAVAADMRREGLTLGDYTVRHVELDDAPVVYRVTDGTTTLAVTVEPAGTFLNLTVEGYGQCVSLDLYGGRLRVLINPDPDVEEPQVVPIKKDPSYGKEESS